ASLDDLGLPESGDGKSDVLEEAKWEADFLVKMQDKDGGFYFLVYPRDREYENDVLPDKGDPQVVFPKTTSVTAAATAALAQCASSPVFKREFPDAAARYLSAARKGWDFLEKAIQKYGKDGSYQKITHYGNEFMHDDELAWAACELFLATGDDAFHKKVIDWLKPSDPETRRWGWWRLYDSYGCAIRSYAFAARTGRLKREQLNEFLLEDCEKEIASAGEDQLRRARDSAYGTSFPTETKRALSAGWYFSSDAAFDLAVACQLDFPVNRDPRQDMMEALVSNLNYEQGCNPVDVTYLTGLGWHRQREIVDQFALNDRRILPPTGIPLGNVQAGFGWNYLYQSEPDKLMIPLTSTDTAPYPFYDRWGDGFNLSQEFVIVNQARGLAYTSWLMAQTPLKGQSWRAANAIISEQTSGKAPHRSVSMSLSSAGLDLREARIVWEAEGQEPRMEANFTAPEPACHWVEAEAQMPDGRRIFAVKENADRTANAAK
ncbi:MAG TPA: glycoside hydrolase family 9 protein, partial [Verrucomicrobiae bacterium]|nr:glycoside hydrolase family 9 protein [Verrucomicrobiae bacterium]